MACQFGAIFLKIMFYSFCHPWSELIRNPEQDDNDPEEINVISNLTDRSKLNDEFKKMTIWTLTTKPSRILFIKIVDLLEI